MGDGLARNSNSNITSTDMASRTNMAGLSQTGDVQPRGTFQEQHSPIHAASASRDKKDQFEASPKVPLDEMLRASH